MFQAILLHFRSISASQRDENEDENIAVWAFAHAGV